MKKFMLAAAVILGLGAVGIAAQMFMASSVYANCPVVQPPPPK
jgi:hypothetical protein